VHESCALTLAISLHYFSFVLFYVVTGRVLFLLPVMFFCGRNVNKLTKRDKSKYMLFAVTTDIESSSEFDFIYGMRSDTLSPL
jgi:hypothetical protein